MLIVVVGAFCTNKGVSSLSANGRWFNSFACSLQGKSVAFVIPWHKSSKIPNEALNRRGDAGFNMTLPLSDQPWIMLASSIFTEWDFRRKL